MDVMPEWGEAVSAMSPPEPQASLFLHLPSQSAATTASVAHPPSLSAQVEELERLYKNLSAKSVIAGQLTCLFHSPAILLR